MFANFARNPIRKTIYLNDVDGDESEPFFYFLLAWIICKALPPLHNIDWLKYIYVRNFSLEMQGGLKCRRIYYHVPMETYDGTSSMKREHATLCYLYALET